jgi:hypothetical protein
VTQQQGFHLLMCAQPRRQHILAGARRIAQRLIALIGHYHRDEIAGARLACQQQRIAPIGLDALLDGAARKGVAYLAGNSDR